MGELAGISCALFWAISATIFSEASRRIGAGALNRIRLLIGLSLFLVTSTLISGSPVPLDAGLDRWLLFGASGILGLAIGDGLMYQAYNLIGTRLAMLVTALLPIFSALIAWLFLDEKLTFTTGLGILLAVVGVGAVVLERRETGRSVGDRRAYIAGLLISLMAVLMYSIGNVMSKKGLADNFSTVSGVVIRMIFANLFTWSTMLFNKNSGGLLKRALQDKAAMRYVLIGSLIGPFGGIWLSFVALQNTQVGVATTLISTAPLFLLPIARWVNKEQLSWRAIAGTLVAISGVAVIFLV